MGKSEMRVSINKELKNKEISNQNPSKEKKISKNTLTSIPKRSSPPFGSSSVKTTLNPSKLTNDPGPGSYLNSQINSNLNTISNNKFFITGETRFKSSDNHIPGVGEYNIDLYNNKFNTPKKMSSFTYKRMNFHDFILNEKIQTMPNKLNDEENTLINTNIKENSYNNINSVNNILNLKKHNNTIDWRKVSKKNLEIDTNNINNINTDNKNITNDFIMLTEFDIISNKKNDTKIILNKNNTEQKQVIYKNNSLGFKDNYDSSNINLTSFIKKNKKIIEPGPGSYEPLNNNFKFEPKKNKYQNFGTYESRNMMPIPLNKSKIKSDNNLNKFRFKKRLEENNNKLNKYKRLLHNLRFNLIKEQSKQFKKNVEDNLGPGSYSPNAIYDMKKFRIQNLSKTLNINKNEERKPSYIDINNNPGVGEYDVNGEFKKNIEKNLSLLKSKKDKEKYEQILYMEKFKKKLKKKEKKFIYLDYVDTEEYKIRMHLKNNNIFRPPFNSAEPKFKKEKLNDINIISNEITNYQKKEMNYLNVPFLSKAKRWNDDNNKSIEKIGPGSYEQKSFFDWNKKSFNVQYKLK